SPLTPVLAGCPAGDKPAKALISWHLPLRLPQPPTAPRSALTSSSMRSPPVDGFGRAGRAVPAGARPPCRPDSPMCWRGDPGENDGVAGRAGRSASAGRGAMGNPGLVEVVVLSGSIRCSPRPFRGSTSDPKPVELRQPAPYPSTMPATPSDL